MVTTVKKYLCLIAALAGGIVLSSAAWCAEFTADVAIDQNGVKYEAKAYVKGTSVRYELTTELGPEIIIYRADFGAQWTIYPEMGVYDELWNYRSDDFIMPEVDRRLIETTSFESLGTKTVAGFECDVHYYRYDDPDQGTLVAYHARTLDYPVRIELNAKRYYLTKEYRNIVTNLLDDSLFKIPPGYSMLK